MVEILMTENIKNSIIFTCQFSNVDSCASYTHHLKKIRRHSTQEGLDVLLKQLHNRFKVLQFVRQVDIHCCCSGEAPKGRLSSLFIKVTMSYSVSVGGTRQGRPFANTAANEP